MSIIDSLGFFSNPQTVTTSTNTGLKSTTAVDLTTVRKIGAGKPLYITVVVTTLLAMDSTQGLRVSLQSDDNDGLNSATEIQEIGVLAANSAVGTKITGVLSPSGTHERYMGLLYKTTTGNALSAGAVKAFITETPDSVSYPASGFSIPTA